MENLTEVCMRLEKLISNKSGLSVEEKAKEINDNFDLYAHAIMIESLKNAVSKGVLTQEQFDKMEKLETNKYNSKCGFGNTNE